MSISLSLRQRLRITANYRCGYCQTQERVSGVPLTIEHLFPVALGGTDDELNLWLSCRLCNEAKSMLIEAIDTITGGVAPLFNPRLQLWSQHFVWDSFNTQMLGLTPTGRATILTLDLNSTFRISSRILWVEAGLHPPHEE